MLNGLVGGILSHTSRSSWIMTSNRRPSDIQELNESDKDEDDVFKECKKFYDEAKKSNIILLKGKNVPDLWKTYKRPLTCN